jgi:hypothetical protein
MRGFEVVRHSCMDLDPDLTRVAFDYLADKVTMTGAEALVVDTVHFFIELVPLSLSIRNLAQTGRVVRGFLQAAVAGAILIFYSRNAVSTVIRSFIGG